MPTIQEIIAQFDAQLQGQEAQAQVRLVGSYERVYRRLKAQQDALLEEVVAKRAAGEEIGAPAIHKLSRYRELLSEIEAEVDRYGAVLQDNVDEYRQLAVDLGINYAEQSVIAGLGPLPPSIQAQVMATFRRMPTEAIAAMTAALQEQSPLGRLLQTFGKEAAQGIGDALLRNLLAGKHPSVTAREMLKAWGMPLTRALRIARTEHLRAHRMASLASWRNNPHLVPGWRWHAHLDARVCMSCVAKHGQKFPVTETMDDHPNGRCAMVPATPSWKELGFEDIPETGADAWLHEGDGRQWFEKQPEGQQREMMGESLFRAWKAGKVGLDQLSVARESPEWGRTFTVPSLIELLGDNARDHYATQKAA